MDIKNHRPDPAAARSPAPVPPIRDQSKPAESEVDHNPDGDSGDGIDTSDEARSRAASSVAKSVANEIPFATIAAERVLEIRRRIQERVQDTNEVADEVMRRIVARGDLP